MSDHSELSLNGGSLHGGERLTHIHDVGDVNQEMYYDNMPTHDQQQRNSYAQSLTNARNFSANATRPLSRKIEDSVDYSNGHGAVHRIINFMENREVEQNSVRRPPLATSRPPLRQPTPLSHVFQPTRPLVHSNNNSNNSRYPGWINPREIPPRPIQHQHHHPAYFQDSSYHLPVDSHFPNYPTERVEESEALLGTG